MRVAGLLPERLRRRRAAPREASRLLLPAPVAERQVLPGPAVVPAARTGEYPYPAVTASDITAARLTVRRIADGHRQAPPRPVFYPATPAPETAPQRVIAAADPAGALDMNEVLRLRRLRDVRDGLLGIDFEALDAARGLEGVTHAAMRRERGPAPFYDALEASWQPPQGPRLTGGEYLAGRIDDLKALYPSPRAVNSAYSEVLDWVTAITGTTGFAPSRWPQAAIGCAS